MDNCIGWQGLSYCTDSQYNGFIGGTKLKITYTEPLLGLPGGYLFTNKNKHNDEKVNSQKI